MKPPIKLTGIPTTSIPVTNGSPVSFKGKLVAAATCLVQEGILEFTIYRKRSGVYMVHLQEEPKKGKRRSTVTRITTTERVIAFLGCYSNPQERVWDAMAGTLRNEELESAQRWRMREVTKAAKAGIIK
jgi:hypothetical protein